MDSLVIPTLETERLRLRPLRASDFEDYAALWADPEVLALLGGEREPWDRGRSWRHLAFLIGHWHLGRPGMWAVERKEDGAFLGVGGFVEPEGWPGFELAGWGVRRSWEQGYATEAGRAALEYAFKVLGKERVISLVHPENQASIRVIERLGGKLVDHIEHLGKEMLRYGFDRETWEASAPRESLLAAS